MVWVLGIFDPPENSPVSGYWWRWMAVCGNQNTHPFWSWSPCWGQSGFAVGIVDCKTTSWYESPWMFNLKRAVIVGKRKAVVVVLLLSPSKLILVRPCCPNTLLFANSKVAKTTIISIRCRRNIFLSSAGMITAEWKPQAVRRSGETIIIGETVVQIRINIYRSEHLWNPRIQWAATYFEVKSESCRKGKILGLENSSDDELTSRPCVHVIFIILCQRFQNSWRRKRPWRRQNGRHQNPVVRIAWIGSMPRISIFWGAAYANFSIPSPRSRPVYW